MTSVQLCPLKISAEVDRYAAFRWILFLAFIGFSIANLHGICDSTCPILEKKKKKIKKKAHLLSNCYSCFLFESYLVQHHVHKRTNKQTNIRKQSFLSNSSSDSSCMCKRCQAKGQTQRRREKKTQGERSLEPIGKVGRESFEYHAATLAR